MNARTNFLKQGDLGDPLKTLADSERKAGHPPQGWEYACHLQCNGNVPHAPVPKARPYPADFIGYRVVIQEVEKK